MIKTTDVSIVGKFVILRDLWEDNPNYILHGKSVDGFGKSSAVWNYRDAERWLRLAKQGTVTAQVMTLANRAYEDLTG